MTFTQDLSVISSIAALWIVVTIMPGLDFLLVTRLAILQGRMAALRAALGIAVGVGLWGLAGFFGIRALFVAAPWLYLVLKIGGGLYLFVLGVRLFVGSWKKQSEDTMPSAPNMETVKGFRMGLLTNLANPKVPVFVTSLFAASLPQQASMGLGLSCVVMMFGMAIGWYTGRNIAKPASVLCHVSAMPAVDRPGCRRCVHGAGYPFRHRTERLNIPSHR